MRRNMDELLKVALTPMDVPEQKVNDQILRKVKERQNMDNNQMRYRRRIPAAVLVTACILVLCSSTAYAVYKYLTPAEAAIEANDDSLQKAFLSEGAILVNETQESGGFRITLLGSVAGKNISDFLSMNEKGEVEDDRIYTVIAIEHVDGTPMPDTSSDEYGKDCFYASHYIHGLNPREYSIMSMGGGYTEFVRDGIQYRILDMDNIEMFADQGIYVGVSSGTFYDNEAYIYDESTGEMSRNTGYGGVNALFSLPVDKSKADPEAAAAYLRALEESMNTPDEPVEKDAVDLSVEDFMNNLTPENLDEYAEPIESTRQTCTVDADGNVHYSYELESVSADDSFVAFEFLFPDNKPGISPAFNWSYTETGLTDLCIDVFVLNEDGTVTFVVYQPKNSEKQG